jgi:hypothetical protein
MAKNAGHKQTLATKQSPQTKTWLARQFGAAGRKGGNGIGCRRDRPTNHQLARPSGDGLGGGKHPFLIV